MRPVTNAEGLTAAQARAKELRRTRPLVESESVDVVVSNCVLNLVETQEKRRLFGEIYRVLRSGGRAVISEIVSREPMTLEQILPYLEEGAALGVKDYYFTGGEPFLNPEMEAILARALEYGPASVLTNGLLLDPERCRRLRALADGSDYSLDLRVSLDGHTAEADDPIRGEGTFERILEGVGNLAAVGLNPVLTFTEVYDDNGTVRGKERFFELLRKLGIDKPRLKMLPVFRIGAEVERILSLTGYVGDATLHRQLQVHECYATSGPMKLAAALLGSSSADCLAQESPGADTLVHPEPGFFLLGSKSYGRNSAFLMRVGWQQVDEVFGLLERA